MRKAKTKKKPRLSPEEKKAAQVKRDHTKLIKETFRAAGFLPIPAFSDKEFTYDGTTSDFDDAFVFQNIIVFCEYTTSQESGIGTHLKKKKILYDKIEANPSSFIQFIRKSFPQFDQAIDAVFQPNQLRTSIVYCSRFTVKQQIKDEVPGVKYFDYHIAKYFSDVTKTVKRSARFELFNFLGLSSKDVGDGVLRPNQNHMDSYAGSLLPEGHSHFDAGFKVVSFYIDPQALLERAYVLRKDGWLSNDATYQRMIHRKKVESIRKYLKERRRAFVNNIIVTLPDSTKLIDSEGNTLRPEKLLETQPAIIQLPSLYNSVGIVDGQHRIFSYHEGGSFDDEISKLRRQQNLLVTGIIFPPGMGEEAKTIFEATLFLEINANQANASSQLKQQISLKISPFDPESIARRIVNHLNDQTGPLQDEFERFFFESGKVKTTSIVSFGVRPLASIRSADSLFSIWQRPGKEKVLEGQDYELLSEYAKFCSSQINQFIGAVRTALPRERWTADLKVEDRFLTTTIINGLLSCFRRIVRLKVTYSFEEYRAKLQGLESFPFGDYKSSQYNRMGEAIHKRFFEQ